ncbi:hypothetical protein MYAER_2182 [Microcystis aeruginosa NIES-2549]|uniref:Uncharacterized protein n=1 Tax=Microcystis aeruginosa NIES-2549 TaxID=1641812 RepID=A0A0F6RLA9_MICAE|nr:hypothetical protein MYAER_2182 [Microcystis aeruginosa NIES-2549]AOC52926.1 hypothetical protein amyaer_2207 [Microcystis aeruginosa NIES-2481]
MVFTSILEILGRFLNYFGDLFLSHSRSAIILEETCRSLSVLAA